MRDFILTLIVAFVLFKVFRSFIYRNVSDAFTQNMNDYNRNQNPPRAEGDIIIENQNPSKNKKKDDGDYVDYEEVN